jgi:hypothetical protein
MAGIVPLPRTISDLVELIDVPQFAGKLFKQIHSFLRQSTGPFATTGFKQLPPIRAVETNSARLRGLTPRTKFSVLTGRTAKFDRYYENH